MTLQSSGAISMSQINAEFGRGNNLNAYRGTQWYTDDGSSGSFPSGAISYSNFYGKRVDSPAPPPDPLSVSPAEGYYPYFSVNSSHYFTASANYYGTFSQFTDTFVTQAPTGSSNGTFGANWTNATYLTLNYEASYWPGYYCEWYGGITYSVQHPTQGYLTRQWTVSFVITHGAAPP